MGGETTMESLKNYSRVVNIVVFICSLITYFGVDGLTNIIPDEYKYIVPSIITIAGFILVQLSEDARVSRAEKIVRGERDGTEPKKS